MNTSKTDNMGAANEDRLPVCLEAMVNAVVIYVRMQASLLQYLFIVVLRFSIQAGWLQYQFMWTSQSQTL